MLPSPLPTGGDFRPFGHRPSPPPKTMEDVWQDINLNEITIPQPNLRRPSAAVSPPATVLSLSSGSGFHFSADDRPTDDSPAGDALASSVLASFGNNWPPESVSGAGAGAGAGTGDRRHKRMMKNRESAARSRARKQAYINGLQLKIAHLRQENDKLRENQKKLILMQAEAIVQPPKKHLLQRSSTAPF